MPTVELVYQAECPNVAEARARILRALSEARLPPRWTEWRTDDPVAPARARGRPSPTILVEGVDVDPSASSEAGSACRLYVGESGALQGVPPVRWIVEALKASRRGRGRGNGTWVMIPAIGAALLPKVACPACWPAYAGLLGSFGLGFVLESRALLPLTAGFLALAVAALAFRARRRRGYGPFALGLAAAALVLIGKFQWQSDPALFAGLAVFLVAGVWNGWPRPAGDRGPRCSSCADAEGATR
jgi:hypothetical protein